MALSQRARDMRHGYNRKSTDAPYVLIKSVFEEERAKEKTKLQELSKKKHHGKNVVKTGNEDDDDAAA